MHQESQIMMNFTICQLPSMCIEKTHANTRVTKSHTNQRKINIKCEKKCK